MSGTFSGFSEEDIKRVKNGGNATTGGDRMINKSPKAMPKGNHHHQKTVTFKNNANAVVMKNKTIAASKETSANGNGVPEVVAEIPNDARLSTKIVTGNAENNAQSAGVTQVNVELNNVNGNVKECNISEVSLEKRFMDLDEFQARQKLIEEQNRKRKELLAKALADRTKRTQEEAQRLNEIQDEFKKLDAILSNDVSILRRQIEAASLEYMEVQKKYNKIEREFLDAKMVLHQKQERKEMLTEHLCAIIEKNEERKAEKLSELLSRLQLDGSSAEDQNADDSLTKQNLLDSFSLTDDLIQ